MLRPLKKDPNESMVAMGQDVYEEGEVKQVVDAYVKIAANFNSKDPITPKRPTKNRGQKINLLPLVQSLKHLLVSTHQKMSLLHMLMYREQLLQAQPLLFLSFLSQVKSYLSISTNLRINWHQRAVQCELDWLGMRNIMPLDMENNSRFPYRITSLHRHSMCTERNA